MKSAHMKLTAELWALTITAAATSLMWLPYVTARMQARGLLAIAPTDPGFPPEPEWAKRASRAHGNAIENLAVFAPLVLTAALLEVSTPATRLAAYVYLVARLVHYVTHVTGIPYIRTVAFFVGVCATLVIAAAILSNAG
jgi:uncharacterized MAPEG superfamily protein